LRLASSFGAILLCALATLGCNSQGGHLPKTVPAAGVVTLDGKPVEGAQVVLIPAGDATTGAFGTTNASGHFSLRAFEEKPGAIPGEYKVQVSKTIEVKMQGKLDGGDAVRFEHGVPAKYTGAKTSGLTATIPDAGINNLSFTLTSK